MSNLEYFIIGVVLLIVGLLASGKHSRKWRTASNVLYIIGMALILFAIFALKDSIETIPTEIWNVLEYFVVAGSFFGFSYMIKRDIRAEFDGKMTILRDNLNNRFSDLKDELNNKINNLKEDIHRDFARIEKSMNKKQ